MKKIALILVLVTLLAAGLVIAIAPAGAQAPEGKPFLGIVIKDLDAKLAEKLGLSVQQGVVILKVEKDSPADKAGLKEKDVILDVNGEKVQSVKDFVARVKGAQPGDKLTLGIQRGSEQVQVEVTLGAVPAPKKPLPAPKKPLPAPAPRLKELEGVPPAELFSHLVGGEFTIKDKDGNLVTFQATAGTVSALTGDSITISPNSGGAAITYKVGADTIVRPGQVGSLMGLSIGSKVVVVTLKGSPEQARLIQHAPGLLAPWLPQLGVTPRTMIRPAPPTAQLRALAHTGEVKAISDNTITLGTGKGDETIQVTDETVIIKEGKKVGVTDLAVGDRLLVLGEADESGKILAKRIQVLPSGLKLGPVQREKGPLSGKGLAPRGYRFFPGEGGQPGLPPSSTPTSARLVGG